MNIKINLLEKLPQNNTLNQDENNIPETRFTYIDHKDFPLNKNLNDWDIEIIFDNYRCIIGEIRIPTFGNKIIKSPKTGEVDKIDIGFVYYKTREGKKRLIRWGSYFYDQMDVTHQKFIFRTLRKIKDEIFEKVRIHKEEEKAKIK